MNMNSYKIDFINNTMTITKTFERAANNPCSEEYKLVQKIRADFPTMQFVRKASPAAERPNPFKGLTYAAMERYILSKGNDDLMREFEMVRERSAIAPNPYLMVRNWFVHWFPEYMGQRNEGRELHIKTYEAA